jgi:site-specific DNA recombinase
MNVHVYLRRSKNDEGKQQFSLDVQRAGSREFVERMGLGEHGTSEYVDDGKAGDDFHSRQGIRQLLEHAKPGDVIVCRDQSRLGRDAIEVTLVIRDLVRDRGCRLFYYVTGQEVQFANAIDQATTFIQGTGHQMELEAIRSRTREALRSRVRAGRIAGGRCYGYDLERSSDPSGRRFTVAVVDEDQAAIVRRIFQEYLDGRGLKAIARSLNHEGVASPSAGRRGTGSWAPTCIRSMLQNARYRGVYIHGKIKKLRRSGSVKRVKAEPDEILMVDLPEWRIVEDDVWFAVQERFVRRADAPGDRKPAQRSGKYALTGIARCGECGGAVGVARTKRRGQVVKSYVCMRHKVSGAEACSVAVNQPMQEVEGALIDFIQKGILSGAVLENVLVEIRREVEAQMPKRDADIAALEAELVEARAEQRKLARAVALADDIPELVSELRQRSARIQHLEVQVAASRKTPEEIAAIIAGVEATCRARLKNLRAALSDPDDLRDVFLAMFPDGLTFTAESFVEEVPSRRRCMRKSDKNLKRPVLRKNRRIWRAKGAATLGGLNLVATPTGFEPVSPA